MAEITGLFKENLEKVSKISKKGEAFNINAFTMNTEGQYSKMIKFNYKDKLFDVVHSIKENERIKVYFNVESVKTSNDIYFTNVEAYSIQRLDK